MKNPYIEVLENQLAIDYNCTVEEVRSAENIYRILKKKEGTRPIGDENTMLKVAVYREKLLVMADASLLDWCLCDFCIEG